MVCAYLTIYARVLMGAPTGAPVPGSALTSDRRVTCVLRSIWDVYYIVVLKDSERQGSDEPSL